MNANESYIASILSLEELSLGLEKNKTPGDDWQLHTFLYSIALNYHLLVPCASK